MTLSDSELTISITMDLSSTAACKVCKTLKCQVLKLKQYAASTKSDAISIFELCCVHTHSGQTCCHLASAITLQSPNIEMIRLHLSRNRHQAYGRCMEGIRSHRLVNA